MVRQARVHRPAGSSALSCRISGARVAGSWPSTCVSRLEYPFESSATRFPGSVWREGLDHVLVLGEVHPRRVLWEYVAYFNQEWPHQGIRQHIAGDAPASPVLGGLLYAYQRAA